MSDDNIIVIKGCKTSRAATLLLRGANDYMLDEVCCVCARAYLCATPTPMFTCWMGYCFVWVLERACFASVFCACGCGALLRGPNDYEALLYEVRLGKEDVSWGSWECTHGVCVYGGARSNACTRTMLHSLPPALLAPPPPNSTRAHLHTHLHAQHGPE